MARITGPDGYIHGDWYSVRVVKEDLVEGQLRLTLDETSIKINYRHPKAWLYWALGLVISAKEALTKKKTN